MVPPVVHGPPTDATAAEQPESPAAASESTLPSPPPEEATGARLDSPPPAIHPTLGIVIIPLDAPMMAAPETRTVEELRRHCRRLPQG
jgi:hypothetical protein